MGLHAKAIAIDGRRVFIGSMNLDPRSWRLNSEMGVVVESEGLAADVLAAVERDLRPENAWRVTLDDNGEMIWTAGDEVLHRQPARNRPEEHTAGLQSLMRHPHAVLFLTKKQ